MMARITKREIKEEASVGKTFDLVKWIRARRLKWVGQILRMEDSRMLKQALHQIYEHRQEGDLLMDTPRVSWKRLKVLAKDEKTWQSRVRGVRETNITR